MNDTSSAFNLAGVWQVLHRHWKLVAYFVATVLVITAVLLFFIIPKSYKSTAAIVAANPVLSDKSRVLNNNIQHLYSPYGNGDDLNRLEAIAKLDTVYIALVNEFKLLDYYDLSDEREGMRGAMRNLQQDLIILKTEHDEMHISGTFKDRQLAASIVNRAVEIISSIAEISWKSQYALAFDALQKQIDISEIQLAAIADSLQRGGGRNNSDVALLSKRAALVDQLQQFHKAANEYQLAFNTQPATIVLLQRAYPAFTHDKPRKLQVLFLAFVAAVAFSVLAVLIYDRSIST